MIRGTSRAKIASIAVLSVMGWSTVQFKGSNDGYSSITLNSDTPSQLAFVEDEESFQRQSERPLESIEFSDGTSVTNDKFSNTPDNSAKSLDESTKDSEISKLTTTSNIDVSKIDPDIVKQEPVETLVDFKPTDSGDQSSDSGDQSSDSDNDLHMDNSSQHESSDSAVGDEDGHSDTTEGMDHNGQDASHINSYQTNLAMIRAQTARNTALDSSPYRNVPQAQLDISNSSSLLGLRSEYVSQSNHNLEKSFPVTSGGQFRVACEFSHFAYDDPLLYPDQPGAAHLHMYFGNTDVNAYSNVDTLIDSGSSTCNGKELNRTGYWAPAVIDGSGNARIPERVVVYYKGEGLANGAKRPIGGGAQVYKKGMANIAPSSNSVAEVSNQSGGAVGEVNYKCSNNFSAYPYATGVGEIPNCSGDFYDNTYGAPYPETRTVLEMEVKFWNCFPHGADVFDWRSWMPAGDARGGWFFSNCNGAGGGGSASADIYPNLSYFINYVVEPGEDTSQWYLSSDVDHMSLNSGGSLSGPRGSTHHADWWGGWHPTINEEWINNCVNFINPGIASGCGNGYLSDGGPDNTAPLPGRALKLRSEYDVIGDSSTYKKPMETLFNELCSPLNPGRDFTTAMSASYCKTDMTHNH